MAVLNQTPFQLPDFAKMAYEKSLVDEEKQRREEERQEAKLAQRQRTIEGFGAKKNYLEKGFALEPAAKQLADLAYQQLQQYGTEYENSNSQEALANYERAVGQFNQILGTGLAVRQAVDGEYETFLKSPSSFSLESQKTAKQSYSDRSKMNFAGAIENGIVMATDPTTGKRVPATQLSYFQSSVAPGVNTLGLVPVDPATKFLDPVDYAKRLVNDFKDTQGVRIDTGSTVSYDRNALINKGKASFQSDLQNNPAMMDAIILRHYLGSSGKVPSAQERAQVIVDYSNNPEKLKAAQESYWSSVSTNVGSFVPASSVGARTGGSGGGVTRSQREDIDAIFAGTEGNIDFISKGTFAGQTKDRFFVGGVDIPFKAQGISGQEDMIATGIGVDEDGNFIASIRDANGQLVKDKKAQIALEKSLRRAGTFSPIMNTLKQGYSNSKKVGKTPPGY
jgi:hypothetical protein